MAKLVVHGPFGFPDSSIMAMRLDLYLALVLPVVPG